MRRRTGFSFIEILIAIGIFSIALLPLLPLITQSQRNAAYAEKTYAAQLHAQGLMTVLRAEGENFETVAAEYIAGLDSPPYAYGFWCGTDVYFTSKPFPQVVNQSLIGIPGQLITVLIWDDEGRVTGRATGVIP